MRIIELQKKQNIQPNTKLSRVYDQLGKLLNELKTKELTPKIINYVNEDIEMLNSSSLADNELRKLAKLKQSNIIKLVGKELKIFPKNHYRNLWLVLGMSIFGLPIGVAFGLMNGNMGLLAIGLPIGMLIGMAVGSGMDNKAFIEGRQLDIEIKY